MNGDPVQFLADPGETLLDVLRESPDFRTAAKHRSYPDGYQIETLGPPVVPDA